MDNFEPLRHSRFTAVVNAIQAAVLVLLIAAFAPDTKNNQQEANPVVSELGMTLAR